MRRPKLRHTAKTADVAAVQTRLEAAIDRVAQLRTEASRRPDLPREVAERVLSLGQIAGEWNAIAAKGRVAAANRDRRLAAAFARDAQALLERTEAELAECQALMSVTEGLE